MIRLALACMAALALLLAPGALAVLEVSPKAIDVGDAADFRLRVHSVRDGADTVGVTVRFPDEVGGAALGAPPLGWSMRAITGDRDRIVGVRYHGGVIPDGFHQDFTIRAQALTAGSVLWTARQFYDTGEVVDFDLRPGDPGDRREGIGAITTIRGSGPSAPAASPTVPREPVAPVAPPASPNPPVITDGDTGDGGGPLRALGILLLLVALAAFVALRVLLSTEPGEPPGAPS